MSMRKHIFNAGPCKLSDHALTETAKAVLELGNTGQSILEVSHRSKDFDAVINEATSLFREVLSIPEDYHVLYLGGGASTQFYMIPMNFLKTKAAYINTGTWATGAIKEAKLFGEVDVIASSEDKAFTYIPKDYVIPTDADYFHITTNNTIRGTEYHTDLDSPIPLIADMSSDILSRPVDVSKYAMIYGGAQKNLGPAGLTFVIIKDSMLKNVVADRKIPTMCKYSVHVEKESMNNTPPCINIFTLREQLRWMKSIGGVDVMYEINKEKAKLIYDAIDSSKVFYGPVVKEDRSLMNIPFLLKPEYAQYEQAFLDFAKTRDLTGLKGHRSTGGFRASAYNAVNIEDCKALVKAMEDFAKTI